MDSLTQIVLGAACGEAALGKKIGNKAMLFGAIGGTIPDLDVIVGNLVFGNEIDDMAFHRGFMHSIVFAIIVPFVLGPLVYKLYNSGKRIDMTTKTDWIWLFFLSIFTHPILDSFTPYGTQLFLPFTNHRVAFNTISVVDPLYTLPFLLCLIVAMFFKRTRTRRQWWFKTGVYISSFYMLLTVVNKFRTDAIFKSSLESENISYKRFSVQPTFLNNILWYGIAETETDYKVGFYSLYDQEAKVTSFLSLPKNHDLIPFHEDIETLKWFSNGYYQLSLVPNSNNFYYKDLRYPLLNPSDKNSSVFKFELTKEGTRWNIVSDNREPPSSDAFKAFFKRLKGI